MSDLAAALLGLRKVTALLGAAAISCAGGFPNSNDGPGAVVVAAATAVGAT